MQLTIFRDLKVDVTRDTGISSVTETIVSLFGDVKIVVPPGARVATSGFTLFGDSSVDVEGGDGPELRVNFFSLFGDLTIVEGKARALSAPQDRAERPTFPY